MGVTDTHPAVFVVGEAEAQSQASMYSVGPDEKRMASSQMRRRHPKKRPWEELCFEESMPRKTRTLAEDDDGFKPDHPVRRSLRVEAEGWVLCVLIITNRWSSSINVEGGWPMDHVRNELANANALFRFWLLFGDSVWQCFQSIHLPIFQPDYWSLLFIIWGFSEVEMHI